MFLFAEGLELIIMCDITGTSVGQCLIEDVIELLKCWIGHSRPLMTTPP